nr:MAG: DNA pilot protein [Microviridae sp.]
MIPELIAAGAGLAQSSMNAAQNNQNQTQNFGQNMALSNLQYQQQIDMWNKANAYNTPASQMQRFKDAGLNPNLIYGQGNPGNSPNVLPKYEAPTARFNYQPSIDLPSGISMYQDMRVKDAQVDNIKAQTDSTNNLTLLRNLEALDLKAKNWYNFGNRDMGKWVNTLDHTSNYDVKSDIGRYSADVLSQTVEDQVRKIRLANQQAESMIPNIKARTEQTGLMNQYQSQVNKFTSGNQITNIISKLVPLLLKF